MSWRPPASARAVARPRVHDGRGLLLRYPSTAASPEFNNLTRWLDFGGALQAGGRSPPCSGTTPREQHDDAAAGHCHLDLSRVVKRPVLGCTASQDIKAKATSSLRHKGPFHHSSRRLS